MIKEESVPTEAITTHNVLTSTRGEGRQPGIPSHFDPKTATGRAETSASGGGLETSGETIDL